MRHGENMGGGARGDEIHADFCEWGAKFMLILLCMQKQMRKYATRNWVEKVSAMAFGGWTPLVKIIGLIPKLDEVYNYGRPCN